jgi:hypothetical protein
MTPAETALLFKKPSRMTASLLPPVAERCITRPMPKWIIDAKTRTATSADGATVRFSRGEARWTSDPHSKEALAVWNAALGEGAAILARVGQTLYGMEWRSALAHDLELGRNTPYHWETGKTPFTLSHPVWGRIRALVASRRRELDDLEQACPAVMEHSDDR